VLTRIRRDFLLDYRKFDIRLSEKDFKLLEKNAHKCRLTKSAYMRQLLNSNVPREVPPADYYGMRKKLEVIEEELDTIAQIAAATGIMDEVEVRQELYRLRDVVGQMEEAIGEM